MAEIAKTTIGGILWIGTLLALSVAIYTIAMT
jgi:hypothetical protein